MAGPLSDSVRGPGHGDGLVIEIIQPNRNLFYDPPMPRTTAPRISLCALALSAALATPAAAWTHPDASEGPDDNASLPNAWSVHDRERAQLGQVVERLRKGDTNYTIMAEHLRLVLEDAGFAALTPPEQHYAYLLYGGALFYSGQFDTAREPIRHASEMADAGASDWEFRLRNAIALKDYADAAGSATTLAQRWPSRIATFDARIFQAILSETQGNPQTAPLAARLQAALAAAHS
jgi:hypothetical protein